MNESDFEAQASATLTALERALENCGEELDFELKAGGSYNRPVGVEHNIVNSGSSEFAFIEIELK